MKKISTLALLWTTAGLILSGCAVDAPPPAEPLMTEACKLEGKVIKITDGDTINVLDINNETHKIRLAGIDAPERGQAYGKSATKYLAQQINQQTVCIDWNKRDRYGRLVGKVIYNNTDLNLKQVRAGYAWHYKKYQREQTPADRKLYAQAENTARTDTIGLWSEPSPINPSDWRKGVRISDTAFTNVVVQKPEDFTCGTKRFCGQMGSCAEACFHLQQCGLSRLDGNKDGIPCSKLCRSVCDS